MLPHSDHGDARHDYLPKNTRQPVTTSNGNDIPLERATGWPQNPQQAQGTPQEPSPTNVRPFCCSFHPSSNSLPRPIGSSFSLNNRDGKADPDEHNEHSGRNKIIKAEPVQTPLQKSDYNRHHLYDSVGCATQQDRDRIIRLFCCEWNISMDFLYAPWLSITAGNLNNPQNWSTELLKLVADISSMTKGNAKAAWDLIEECYRLRQGEEELSQKPTRMMLSSVDIHNAMNCLRNLRTPQEEFARQAFLKAEFEGAIATRNVQDAPSPSPLSSLKRHQATDGESDEDQSPCSKKLKPDLPSSDSSTPLQHDTSPPISVAPQVGPSRDEGVNDSASPRRYRRRPVPPGNCFYNGWIPKDRREKQDRLARGHVGQIRQDWPGVAEGLVPENIALNRPLHLQLQVLSALEHLSGITKNNHELAHAALAEAYGLRMGDGMDAATGLKAEDVRIAIARVEMHFEGQDSSGNDIEMSGM